MSIKPSSRFVEHFDIIPPTELLNVLGEEEDRPHQIDTTPKKNTPLYALPPGSLRRTSTGDVFYSPEQSPTDMDISPMSPSSRKSYLGRNLEHSPAIVSSASSSSLNKKQGSGLSVDTNQTNASPTDIIHTIISNGTLSNQQQATEDPIFSPTIPMGTRKKLKGVSLNRAEIIIKRYNSWYKFIGLLTSWMNEIARLSIQAEKSYRSMNKESRFPLFKGYSTDSSTNGIQATMHGFTADLALQEQKFGRFLQTEHIPILEKYKKECTLSVKTLKSRPDLNMEEFLKRAGVTANLISQLTKSCKEARNTIEKGAPVIHDPWLVNLYVLRQLRSEINEENRLRELMVPIQQSMQDFESRLLKSVEAALTACFNKPGALSDAQLNAIQSSLNQAVTNNWSTFAASNKGDIVNEKNPHKNYLNINYTCKNDALVMTVHKGQLERRSGVLGRLAPKFFVITKSGFLHQFKLNDKVSPENSIYLPKSIVIPCMDISDLNHFPEQEKKAPKEGFTFEIQRSGSVLQRDKSYVFRAESFDDMAIWCRLTSELATQSPQAMLLNEPMYTVASKTTSDPSNNELQQLQKSTSQQEIIPLQETTPPPSPIHAREKRKSYLSIIEYQRRESQGSIVSSLHSSLDSLEDFTSNAPKVYKPQLNI